MKRNVVLTKEEYDYLINNLLVNRNDIFSKIILVSYANSIIVISLTDDTSEKIRELTEDRIGMNCYKDDGFPTEEGWILEHFIDKFFTG